MVEEVLPDVYEVPIGEDGQARVYLVLDDVPTLIDVGFEHTTESLFDAIDGIGQEPERLVVTHGDPDHVGGFDAVVERYDPETWVPEETEIEGTATPDHRFSDGDEIGSFEAVHAPGHEPDNYALVDEGAGILFPGDAVFGSDSRGLPPGYLIPPPALYSDDVDLAEKSMERLLDYEFDAVLVFHGTIVTEDGYDRLESFVRIVDEPHGLSYV